ncbi:MAG: EAL domain-containing protein, partial [Hydrogenophaga sp.]|nr:EAL domain-containing protein [Hydrogenophaga sp.]
RAKDGSLYWVYTTIVPFVGKDGISEQYIAIRADITKRKEAEQEAQRMAFHDALTGLPNRRLMSERVRQAIVRAEREKHHGALMLMDLDHFKEINDTLGHAQGDELLRQVAERLRTSVRQADTVARLGGDEFVVLLDDLGGGLDSATAHAGDVGEKIRETLASPYELHGERVTSTPSIGVVLFRGTQDDPEELLKQADLALYKAKEAGRNRLRFFDPSLQDDINNRSSLLRDLRLALDEGQMRLYYQPVVDKSRHVVGVEALVRWAHPKRGLVPPATFIPLAEQTNLILPIGKWVLDTACAQIRTWEDDPIRSTWTVAVNVSARQFYEAEFVANVERALSRAGADPRRLRLELTESLLQSDLEGTITKMHTLGRLGVRFSLDDFGTGYSSLSYLKRLPLDQFKIDKSFVNDILTDPNDAAIAKTILALAASLELGVVAEGVENAAQFELLVSYGCEGFQGYLFSKPVPVESLPTGQLT